MGIYSRKYMLEAAPEDVAANADASAAEVIDNIEQNVSDEVIGVEPEKVLNTDTEVEVEIPEDKKFELEINPVDPVAESYAMLFEEEYNYNQLMRTIGMYELNEAAHGREVIYEAADVKGFIQKIIQAFKDAWAKVSAFFMKVIADLKEKANKVKEFRNAKVTKLITDGFADVKTSVYDIDPAKLAVRSEDDAKKAVNMPENLANMKNIKVVPSGDDLAAEKRNIAKSLGLELDANESPDDMKAINEKFKKNIIGERVAIEKAQHFDLQYVLKEIASSNNIKTLVDSYNALKKFYTSLMSATKELENASKKAMDSKNDSERVDAGKMMAYVHYCVSKLRYAQDIERAHYMMVLRACITSDTQVRSVAARAMRYGMAKNKGTKEEPAAATTHEAAGMRTGAGFDSITFM